jgi:hypothetical protein
VSRRRLLLLVPILVLLALCAWRFWPRGGADAFPYEGVNDPPAPAATPTPHR